jgi:hypothetical protein
MISVTNVPNLDNIYELTSLLKKKARPQAAPNTMRTIASVVPY